MFQKKFKFLSILFLVFSSYLCAEENTPRKNLSSAIEKGDLAKVQSFIESAVVGIDELSDNFDPQSPLLEAVSKSKISIIKYLIEKGACVNGISQKNYSSLEKFIESSRMLSNKQLIETIVFMIDHGVDINGCGDDGYTPLMAACKHTRSIELLDLLLDKGAFMDAESKDEETAYLVSIRNNNLNAYRLLINRGANVNVTYKGMNILSLLAWDGNIFMMKIILDETDANVNGYNPNGTTPLICAVLGSKSAMIQFLIDRGANINALTTKVIDVEINKNQIFKFGRTYVAFPKRCTALNFASTLGLVPIANLLIERGGIIYQDVEYKEVFFW
ncbi:MAG: ankyrin repeat domain-containing protein [Parachlamydiales bacterium]|jgi:ankyrin repeat protein